MVTTAQESYLLKAGEGKSVRLGGLGVVFKIPGNETGGLLSVVEHRSIRGGSYPLMYMPRKMNIPTSCTVRSAAPGSVITRQPRVPAPMYSSREIYLTPSGMRVLNQRGLSS
jgi:hypothetical protein